MYLCVVFRSPERRRLILIAGTDISGVPGTGKTATVHAVVRELKRMAEQNVCSVVTLTLMKLMRCFLR
jgi:Cdc6-like AAA superfamily ATPase